MSTELWMERQERSPQAEYLSTTKWLRLEKEDDRPLVPFAFELQENDPSITDEHRIGAVYEREGRHYLLHLVETKASRRSVRATLLPREGMQCNRCGPCRWRDWPVTSTVLQWVWWESCSVCRQCLCAYNHWLPLYSTFTLNTETGTIEVFSCCPRVHRTALHQAIL